MQVSAMKRSNREKMQMFNLKRKGTFTGKVWNLELQPRQVLNEPGIVKEICANMQRPAPYWRGGKGGMVLLGQEFTQLSFQILEDRLRGFLLL